MINFYRNQNSEEEKPTWGMLNSRVPSKLINPLQTGKNPKPATPIEKLLNLRPPNNSAKNSSNLKSFQRKKLKSAIGYSNSEEKMKLFMGKIWY